MTLQAIGAAVSIGTSIYGMANSGSGGGGGGSSAPVGYQPNNQPGVDNSFNSLYTAANNAPAQFNGYNPNYANQSFNAAFNNPYSGQMVDTAQQAGNIYEQSVNPLMQSAGYFAPQVQNQINAGNQAYSAGQTAYNTALDPQNALYAQQRQINDDQTRANLAASGLSTSGVGVGIQNQSDQNFNTNWQAQQLQRQIYGANALNSGVNTMNNAVSGAGTTAQGMGQLYGQAAGNQGLAGATPYNAQNVMAGNQNTALTANSQNLQNYLAPGQQSIGNALQYMGQGTSAANGWNGANNAYQQMQYQNQQGMGQAFGNGITSLGNSLFPKQSAQTITPVNSSGGGVDWGNLFSGSSIGLG